MRKLLPLVLLTVLLTGCGNGTKKVASPVTSVFPTAPGTTWIYEEAGMMEGSRVTVTYRVLPSVKVSGRTLVPIQRSEPDAAQEYEFYEVTDGKVYYIDTLVGEYNPDAVKLQGSSWGRPTELKVGMQWGDGAHFAYKVIGRDAVTVPAGSFPDAYVVEMQVDDTYTDRLYYVDGVGLVKEEPENHRVLLSFTPGKP